MCGKKYKSNMALYYSCVSVFNLLNWVFVNNFKQILMRGRAFKSSLCVCVCAQVYIFAFVLYFLPECVSVCVHTYEQCISLDYA